MTVDKGIPIKNIYYMLSYAFTSLERSYDEEIAGEAFDNIHNLFAAILSKGIGHQLKQGLYREYIAGIEETASPHGKLNMPSTMRNRIEHTNRVVCEYDDFSKDNIYNRVIKKTALLLLSSDEVENEYKDVLRKELTFFDGIGDIDPRFVDWSAFRFHRNNQTYRMLLGIAQMIMEGMIISTDDGSMKLSHFVDEQRMCRLYEKFILEYYRKEIPAVTAESSQIQWALDDDNMSLLPIMQSDVMLTYKGEVLIIDAKYYAHNLQSYYGANTIHNANLNQIFTYVKNKQGDPKLGDHKVAGMLLYARTTASLQPDVKYTMSGNTIYVRTLDLNQEFPVIAKQLNSIVNDHFGPVTA